jgi:hypothetical protein
MAAIRGRLRRYCLGSTKDPVMASVRRECVVLLNGDDQQPLTVFTYFGDPAKSAVAKYGL